MNAVIAREMFDPVDFNDPSVFLDFAPLEACAGTDTLDEDALALIEFRYQELWARVELEAVFAAGLMCGID
jgi:hypothetical protein